jgi:hypothetical protein
VNIALALNELYDAELELADEYRKVGERHATEHDVYHQTRTFAAECEAHANAIARFADVYGKSLPPAGGEQRIDSVLALVRRANAALLGRAEQTGLLLLRDLRNLYVAAHEVDVLWVIVGQAAQAARDSELLDTVTDSHEGTMKQWHWLKTRIKESAPQILVAG